MAATGAWRAGRLLAALGAAGAVLAGCSDAPPEPPQLPAPADGLRLELTAPAPEFAPGAQVPLTFTVTNTGAATCDLPATAVGTVTLRVERDGVPVVPETRVLLYPDGAGAVVDAARRDVEPGGQVSFVLPATVGSTEPPDAGLALSSVTPLPTGEGLAAQYALAPGGAYVVTAVYAPGPQGAGRACASSSNPATVSLTTGRAAAWWAWPDGGTASWVRACSSYSSYSCSAAPPDGTRAG